MIELTYFDFCSTERQKEIFKCYLENNKNKYATGRALNINEATVRKIVKKVETRAAKAGYSPDHNMDKVVPDPFYVKGISTCYDREGNVTQQWVKSAIDVEQEEQIKEMIDGYLEDVIVNVPKATKVIKWNKDIIPWFQIGDAHIGMLAHHSETGDNFDLKIGERELCSGIATLIDDCDNYERCVINDLGDFTHYENFAGVTEASGHPLDYDVRFPKMIRVYARIMRFIIDKALSKFKYVDIIINQGNHSRTNDTWMAIFLENIYEKNDRITVLNNDNVFIPYRMGNTFVMVHHSDQCKPNKLAQVMSTDFKKDWGETDFHYIDIGHIHHNMVLKEHPGVHIESFNILAPKDLWAHNNGYRARQSMTCILRSKQYGEVGRRLLSINEVKDNIKQKTGEKTKSGKKVHTV